MKTFDELNAKLSGNENKCDWSQRPNGGGWIHKLARVDSTAFVGSDAIVWGKVSGEAWVSGEARVYGHAEVSGEARVYDNARVYGEAWVYGHAEVSGKARVYDNARVYSDAWEKSPLFIIGSRNSLCNAKHGYLQIGCRCEKFRWWLGKEALKFAKENNYTPDEIKEYRAYVKLFVAVGK